MFRRALPWALALAVATCTDDTTGPSKGGVGYFSFRPVYSGVTSSLSQFGIVADSVHVLLTRPVDQVVLDTTVFFPPDSLQLRMALPVDLEQSPETLTAMIEIKAGGVVLFVDTLDVQVIDGPPNLANIPTATLDYVGPGNNIKTITVFPADTTIFFGDTLFYTSTAVDSSDAAVASYYVAWKTSDTTVAKVNAQGRLIAPNVRGTLQVIGRTPTGVADTADITFAPVPSQILADSGVAQSGQAGDSLATLFVAQVRAADNLPVEGIHVRFLATTAGGAVRDSILVTDANGRVRTRGVLGTTTGAYTFSATIVGTAISTNFTGTASAGAPTAIAISAGNNQVDSAGRGLPLNFAVRVADAFDNPVSGVKVYWNRTVGTGTLVLDSSVTDASGITSNGYTLGFVGVDSVTATIAGTSAFVGFQATAINGLPASVAKSFGDLQTDTVGRALTDSLVTIVTSATGKPVVGAPVVWTVLRGGSTSDDTVLTDVAGRAAVAYTLGTITGADSVRAQAGSVSAIFTANALTGTATTLSIVSGDAQTDTAGYNLPLPFVVHAADSYGNSVTGTDVLFARTAGTGLLAGDTVATDSAGNASMGYTLGALGTDSVTATLLCGCSTVTFTATAISALPASIVTVQGDSQTVVVNTIADTFAVLVRDGANNPVAGERVNWSFIPAAGDFTPILPAASLASFTDSLGVARGIYTAGTTAGTVRVEAQVGAIIDSIFVFATAAAPSAISIVSGDGQADTVGRAIPLPFVIGVTDAFGNPVSGAQVAFTRTFGSGTLFADTVTTNTNGEVAVGYLFGLIPGVDTIRVDLVGTSAFVDFIATAIAAAPASIAAHSGDGQTIAVSDPLADSLEVEVLSGDDDPIVNGAVVWTVVGGGLTLSDDTTYTDLLGRTFVHVLADTVAGTYLVQAQAVGLGSPTTFTVNVVAGTPTTLLLVGGNAQLDTVGTTLPVPLAVHATDTYGNAVSAASVAFTRTFGNGTVVPDTTLTDVNGNASASYTLGLVAGTDTIVAHLVGTGSSVTFIETAVTAAPTSIIATSGTGQISPVATALPESLMVQVLASGVPVPDATVIWAVLRGGTLDVDTVVTDALGYSVAHYTTGTVIGTDSVTATTQFGGLTMTFVTTVQAGAPNAIAILGGDGQVDTAGQQLANPFAASVTDAYGNVVTGAAVVWTVTGGNGLLLSGDTTVTDLGGTATNLLQLDPIPGVNTVRATLAGSSAFVDFTATGIADTPASIFALFGDGQQDTAGQALTDSIVVRVENAAAQPIAGAAVVWTVLRGGSVVTDTTFTDLGGEAWNRYTLGTAAGHDSIDVRVAGGSVFTVITALVVNDVATSIVASAGDAQSDTAGRVLPTGLTAQVTDSFGNPVLGDTVVWSVTSGGGSFVSPDTTVSDANGLVTVSWQLGAAPGGQTARATLIKTAAFVDFGANAVSGAPAFLVKLLGDGQADTVLSTLTDSLVVELRDAGNTPVPNTWLYWVAGGATVSSDSSLTDANGRAAVSVTLGSVKIPASVIVYNADTTITTAFVVTAKPGIAAQITAVGGLGQSGVVDSALPIDFGAFVQDAYGNPVDSGTAVIWSNLAGFAAAGLPDTTVTDSIGVAYLTAPLLGSIVGEDSLTATILGTATSAIFTATATTGPASVLAYVGGTGQTDTVGRLLSQPFTVEARDAGGNPVAGAWVSWSVISGNGDLGGVDSVQTDALGTASLYFTLGQTIAAGPDSVRAVLTASSDTVVFYAVGTPDVPADLVLVSGDLQSATVSTNLAAPMVVKVTDQFGNPIGGVSVDFGVVSGPGLGVATPSPVTDAAGLASSGTVNLLAGAGTTIADASTAAVPADTVLFTVYALPIGTSKQWTGATNNDWGDPANWAPAGVPTSTDIVFVPVGVFNSPFLNAAQTVGGLQIESGAVVGLDVNDLTVIGDVKVASLGGITTGGGHLELAGPGSTVQGYLPTTEVTGTVTLAAATTFADLSVTTGSLSVGGQTLDITGALATSGTGAFVMTNPSDSVTVNGPATFEGSTATGNLTDGLLVLMGDFIETNGAGSFHATGAHRTRFAGVTMQQVTLAGAVLGADQFYDLEAENPAGVTFNSSVAIAGNVYANAPVLSPSFSVAIAGALVDPGSPDWNVQTTQFAGTAAIATDTILNGVEIDGAITLQQSLVVTGAFELNGTSFDLNTHRLDVGGLLSVISGELQMDNATDTLFAHGGVNWAGSSITGLLTAGNLFISGDFTETSPSSTFRASGTHTTWFTDSVAQTITFTAPSAGGDQFQNVVFGNPAGITLASDIAVGDSASIAAGSVSGVSQTALLGGNLSGAVPATWQVGTTEFFGTPTILPDSMAHAMVVSGTVTLPNDVAVHGDLFVSNGSLTLNGHTLSTDSNLTLSGSAQVVMQNAADILDVAGATTWDGSTSIGLLTAGNAIFRGDFSETSSSSTYRASGTHTTVFAGSAPQTVSFNAPGLGGDQFWDVSFNNTAGVTVSSDFAVAGQVNVANGTVTSPGTATVDGSVSGFSGFVWGVELTRFTGTVAVLPDSFPRSVEFATSYTMGQPFKVGGALIVSGGTFDPAGWALRVDSALGISDSGQFQMQNAGDSVDVGGTATFNGSTTAGLLTDGVLVLHGDLSAPAGVPTFQPSGAHRTRFTTGIHTVAFPANSDFTGNRFQVLEVSNSSNVNTASDLYVAGTFLNIAGPTGSLIGSGTQRLVTRGLAVNNWNFDGIRVEYHGPASFQLDNANFVNQDPTQVQLDIHADGGPVVTLNTPSFATTPTSGKYIAVTDTAADAQPVVIAMRQSFPLDGSAFEQEVGGNDGVTIDWSRLVFADQPLDIVAGGTLATVRVALLNPAGDTATFFTDDVTLAIGTNPSSGTLGGTTTQPAVGGIATFSDLTVDNAGIGYTLDASAAGLSPLGSGTFNVTVPLPVGFDAQWTGATSTDWNTPTNWSTGVVPDSTTNVYISAVAANPAQIPSGSAYVNRIQIASGATLDLPASILYADSSVEAFGAITGGANVELRGSGDISGTINATVGVHYGPYRVAGRADISGNLAVLDTGLVTLTGADTATVGAVFGTNQNGRLVMSDANALLDVTGAANFYGASSSADLTLGTIRLAGDLTTGGSFPDAFAPSGVLTVLNGSGVQTVFFAQPDSVTGSHFGRLQVSTAGTAFMLGRYDAMDDLLITNGATLEDSLTAGFEAHGFTTIDAGGTLDVNSFRTRGGIGVAVGATYVVPTTTYYEGTAFPINPAPYDTLVLAMDGQASGDFVITGDLRITGTGAGFDLNGHTVAVGGSVSIDNGANLTMQHAADVLNVAGSFFTNGDSTTGLLTDGLLQIAGSFRQAADGSGESFRASGNHVTRFTGGAGMREIKFDAPSISASDAGGSHFAILDLPDGVDSINGRVAASVSLSIGGSVTYDTTGGSNALASYGTLDILASSDSIHIQTLESWGGLNQASAGLYSVGLTRLWGGSGTLPALPYTDLSIAYTSYTLGADQVIGGSLSLGIYCSEICTSQPGELTVGGHTLTVGADLGVLGFGQLTMGAGDSVDVSGDMTWRGAPNDGHLTGGTLVGRGLFNMVGTDVFQADAAHRTVLIAPATEDMYLASNSWFGKLYVLDGGPRRIRSSQPLVVLDSLVLGATTAELSDTFFNSNGHIEARGPIFTVSGSALRMNGSMRIDVSAPAIFGSYTVANTILGGTGQTVPNLTYGNNNIRVIGTAQMGSAVDIGGGTFVIDGSAGTADLDLNGQVLKVGDFTTGGDATLTSTTSGSQLWVHGNATFDGADQTSKLTDGYLILEGFFTQNSSTSVHSYVSSGNHTTVFADSLYGGSQAITSSMTNGDSRFGQVEVDGRGVLFFGDAWIDGGILIDSTTVDSVGGSKVRIAGTLMDPSHLWKVDTTVVIAATASLPDSIDKHLTFDADYTLTNLLRVGGIVTIHDTVAIGGYTLLAHNSFVVEGAGLLQMTNPTDDVQVDGIAYFDGAPTGTMMSAGRLTLKASLFVPNPGRFNATGTHNTVLNSGGHQVLTFTGGAQGYGFNDLELRGTDLNFAYGALAHGTIRDSVGGPTIGIASDGSPIEAGAARLLDVEFNDAPLITGDSLLLGNITFAFADPEGKTQLTIKGAGQANPVDLNGIYFNNVPTTGQLLAVIDTLGGADSLNVRVFGSVPFDGSTLTSTAGNASAAWSHLALSAPLPATIDSLAPFGLTMVVKQPDGTNWPDVIGSVDISLVNGGGATLGGGTTATFDGQSANFFGLTLDQLVTGASFHFQMQGRAIDSLNTAPFDVLNPIPSGSVVFTGAVSTDWSDGGNWLGSSVPGPTSDVYIAAGQAAFIPPSSTYVVNNVVLGTGAGLDLGFGSTLTVNGNAYAGQTITGSGSIVIAGGASQISGTFPSLTVTGSVSAVGVTHITGDLIIDGTGDGAEFNVGGQKVDVSGTLYTQNSGLLTMDGAADTLYIGSASFAGGNEFGRLSDGVLIVQGSNFDQGFGDPASFMATGNHTTIFADGGSAAAVNITTPGSSQFASVKVQNPNSVDFNESGLGLVRMVGNLELSAGGVASGDTLQVYGFFTSDASSTITLNQLSVVNTPTLAGNYNVFTTLFSGPAVTIPAAPIIYEQLVVDGAATLGNDVTARTVLLTGSGQMDVNGYSLLADSLFTTASGTLVMDNAEDTVLVADTAAFFGGDESTLLTDGVLRLGGSFNATGDGFISTGNHLTEFINAIPKVMKISPDGYCEGSCPFSTRVQFAHLKVDATKLSIDDPVEAGLFVGELTLVDATVTGSYVDLQLGADIHADATTALTLRRLLLSGTLDVQVADTAFNVATVQFQGNGQQVPDLNYNQILFTGALVSLADTIDAVNVVVSGSGVLDMNGMPLTTSGNFLHTGASHVLMQDPADTLTVNGTAIFNADSTFGDFTAGAIRTGDFWQQHGATGHGFQELGSHRVIPMSGALIRMADAGPGGSYLKTIDFTGGDNVDVQGLWVTDTIIINDGGASAVGADDMPFHAGMALVLGAGTLDVPRLGLGGDIAYTGGTFNVDTTVFADFSSTRVIPTAGIPYQNIEVLYAAQLGGDLDLRTGGYSIRVLNTGDLDLAGHTLEAVEFRTEGYGRLTMHSPADHLVAFSTAFDGDSTNLSLTSGTITTQYLEQQASISSKSYAPSGDHRLELVNLGSAGDGVAINLQTPGLDSSHANILHVTDYGMMYMAPITVLDTFLLDVSINGLGGRVVDAFGPVVLGPSAIMSLDTLIVHDTLVIDPSASYNVGVTVYPQDAQGITAYNGYNSMILEGDQTLTGDLSLNGTLTLRKSGALTVGGHNVAATNDLDVTENARLVMTDPADTVEVANANFDGASSTSDLTAGTLRLRNGLSAGNSTNNETFAPNGMVTEFYGGGTAYLANSSAPQSFIQDLRVIEGTTIAPTSYFLVMGQTTIKDGSTFNGNSAPAAIDFRGKVAVLDTSIVTSAQTLFFSDSLTMATPGNYSVANTRFNGTKGIPDLPYQGVIIDGVQMTLTHSLTASGQMIITGSTPGATQIQLGGHTITAGDFDVSGYARIVMADPIDTVVSAGYVSFAGEDETGLLSAGTIRVGGNFTQNGAWSSLSFAPSGTTTEFVGTATHSVTFQNPSATLSRFDALSLLDGGTLQPTSGIVATGTTTIDTSSTFDGQLMGPSDAALFNGKVQVLELGQMSNAGSASFDFRDSLTVAPTASYAVYNTVFQGTDGIPDVFYTHLYLRQGVHLTLTHRLAMSGGLNIQNDNITGNPADTVRIRLNGNKVSANGMYINGYARVTMDNAADTLEIFQDATFRGIDQDTALAAGVIRIGRGFAQNGQFSQRSFAPAGTRTEFYGSLTHQASFTDPSTGASHFADLSVVDAGTLSPLTMMTVAGATTVGGSAHFDGNGIPLGSVVDFLGPVTVQAGGDFHAAFSPAYFNFYGNVGLTVLSGASVPYDVLNSGFVNSSAIPDLPYKNLFLAGRDSILSGNITADSIVITDFTYVGPGRTLVSNGDLVVDGSGIADLGILKLDDGTVIVADSFITQNAGYLVSGTGASSLSAKNVFFNGGSETTHLTRGTLTVGKDFASGIGTSFDADSLFTVNFTGGGNHNVFLGNYVSQHFGDLRLTANSFRSDTLTLTSATFQAYKLTASGNGLLTASPAVATLQVEALNVDGMADSGVTINQYSLFDQPLAFDNVTFRGFSATAAQLVLTDNGQAVPYIFDNIDFDDAANPDLSTGFFVLFTDNDGAIPYPFNLIIRGPDSGVGASKSFITSAPTGSISWQPPS